MIEYIKSLPGAPAWKAVWITLPEAPKDPQLLLYRDPLQCLEWLEANPEFTNDKDYLPYEEYLDPECKERCYSEMASGEAWNEIQAEFDEAQNITVNPVILTMDSTQLTNLSGDKKVKPLLISSGHICQHIRTSPNCRAFLCTAFLPEGKYPHVAFQNPTQARELQGLFNRHLYHISMRYVLASLIHHETVPRTMLDSEGFLRQEIICIVALIADLPEQALNTCLAPNQCANCMAGTKQLGDSKPCQCRTGASILASIAQVKQANPGASAYKFLLEAKKVSLNGVKEPWWQDFKHLDICKIICPDILHGLHKAFKDHIANWNTNLLGKLELDARFQRLPKFPGFWHFSAGISRISQWTGKEHRDLQRNFLVAIAGHPKVPQDALKATRAELDFIYLAQYQSHTERTLSQLGIYNNIYHQFKDIFIKTGARQGKKGNPIKHFNIPKVHTRHHYPPFIRRLGSAIGFSTETPERYHIEYAKKAYKGVSRRAYAEQMVRWLDRQEKIRYFDHYLNWRLRNDQKDKEQEEGENLNIEVEEGLEEATQWLQETQFALPVYQPTLAIKPPYPKQRYTIALQQYGIPESAFTDAVRKYEAKLLFGDAATGKGWE
jgi:hypothetical protein